MLTHMLISYLIKGQNSANSANMPRSGGRCRLVQVDTPRGGFEIRPRERQPASVMDWLDVPKLQSTCWLTMFYAVHFISFHLMSSHFLVLSLIVAVMLLLAWFLANIVPFFGAAVDLLGASVTPWRPW